MPPVEFQPTISAGERPQTYALDRAATGTGWSKVGKNIKYPSGIFQVHNKHWWATLQQSIWPQISQKN